MCLLLTSPSVLEGLAAIFHARICRQLARPLLCRALSLRFWKYPSCFSSDSHFLWTMSFSLCVDKQRKGVVWIGGRGLNHPGSVWWDSSALCPLSGSFSLPGRSEETHLQGSCPQYWTVIPLCFTTTTPPPALLRSSLGWGREEPCRFP